KGRHLEQVDDRAHGGTEQRGDGKQQGEDGKRRQPGVAQEHGDEDTGKGDHRADRQIDSARQDDEGHADRGDSEKGIVGQKIADHPSGEHRRELRVAQGVGEDEDNYGRDQRQGARVHWVTVSALRDAAGFSRRKKNTADCTAGDCSTRMTRTITALMTRLNSGGKPESRMPVLMAWIVIAPISEARMEKRPPSSEVPPMTTARMASSSSHSPALLASAPLMSAAAMTPASAAQSPEVM